MREEERVRKERAELFKLIVVGQVGGGVCKCFFTR